MSPSLLSLSPPCIPKPAYAGTGIHLLFKAEGEVYLWPPSYPPTIQILFRLALGSRLSLKCRPAQSVPITCHLHYSHHLSSRISDPLLTSSNPLLHCSQSGPYKVHMGLVTQLLKSLQWLPMVRRPPKRQQCYFSSCTLQLYSTFFSSWNASSLSHFY